MGQSIKQYINLPDTVIVYHMRWLVGVTIIILVWYNLGLSLAQERSVVPPVPVPTVGEQGNLPDLSTNAPPIPPFRNNFLLPPAGGDARPIGVPRPPSSSLNNSDAPETTDNTQNERGANSAQFARGVESFAAGIRNQLNDGQDFTGTNFDRLEWKDSLMFPEGRVDQLYDVLREGLTFLPEEGVEEIEQTVEVVLPKVAPAFYLNSVLYYKPDSWTIWLNYMRIRAGATFPKLEISEVREDKVIFIWETENLDLISPNWKDKLKWVEDPKMQERLGEWEYCSKDWNIFVDSTQRKVRFILGANQTFVSRQMRIVEGERKSTFLDLQPSEGAFVEAANNVLINGISAPSNNSQLSIPQSAPNVPAGQDRPINPQLLQRGP